MRKLPPFVASSLCLLLIGCQTPMFSDGLFSSLNPQKTLTTQKASSATDRSVSATKPRIGGRGWRNASSRAAETRAKTPAIGINNVVSLRKYLAKGNDSMQKGLYDDARIQYETVLSLEPHHATAHHMLGRIGDMSRQFDEAERHYLEALSTNREDGYLLSDLGYSYLQQGRVDEARKYLMQAIAREPDLAIAKVNLAAAYAYAGDKNGALAWLRQVGNEQQAQETLAGITSKPAPWIMNGAAEALASGPDKYTITKDGQVLDTNGQPLTTFNEVQQAMKEIRSQQQRARTAAEQRDEYLQDRRIQSALAEQRGYVARSRSQNDDANLNQQMQEIAQASGSNRRRPTNSGVIHIGPRGQQNGMPQSDAPGQFQSQGNGNTAPQSSRAPQGQIQQYQSGGPASGGALHQGQHISQQNPYAHLLNPAGPMAVPPQQSSQPGQQTPPYQPGMQGSSVPPHFPGSAYGQSQPPNGLAAPQHLVPGQYQSPNLSSGHPNGTSPQGQPAQTYRQFGDNVSPSTNPAIERSSSRNSSQIPPPLQTAPQQLPRDAVPRDQYGNPIQSLAPTNPAWNGQQGTAQPGVTQPRQGNSAPGRGFYGQSGSPQNAAPSAGKYAGNSPQLYTQPSEIPAGQVGQPYQFPSGNGYYSQGQSVPTNPLQSVNGGRTPQQIQQLSFNDQQPMARIDRGQRLQQYSEADRQAMRLGMAAGFGALAPINTHQSQSQQQGQPFENGTLPNNLVPNGGPQQPANLQGGNSGFSDDPTSGQSPQQSQQTTNRGYPGAVPPNSGRLPGQASIQAPVRQIHGQSLADQMGLDPQTAQPWLRMPTSQADVTRPVAFSNSTQPTEQQSANWQQPGFNNQPWQNQVLASPTTKASFGQPPMTNPHMRPANSQNEQPTNGQSVPTASWSSQQ